MYCFIYWITEPHGSEQFNISAEPTLWLQYKFLWSWWHVCVYDTNFLNHWLKVWSRQIEENPLLLRFYFILVKLLQLFQFITIYFTLISNIMQIFEVVLEKSKIDITINMYNNLCIDCNIAIMQVITPINPGMSPGFLRIIISAVFT